MEMTVYSRIMSTVLLAAGVTIGLFLIMKVLVTGQEYEIEEELASIGIDFVRVERDEESQTKDRALKRPSKVEPEEPPPPPKLTQPNRPNVDKASMSADMGAFDLAGLNLNAPVDGDTLAIVRVLPRYPSAPCRAALRAGCCWNLPLMSLALRLIRWSSTPSRRAYLTARQPRR